MRARHAAPCRGRRGAGAPGRAASGPASGSGNAGGPGLDDHVLGVLLVRGAVADQDAGSPSPRATPTTSSTPPTGCGSCCASAARSRHHGLPAGLPLTAALDRVAEPARPRTPRSPLAGHDYRIRTQARPDQPGVPGPGRARRGARRGAARGVAAGALRGRSGRPRVDRGRRRRAGQARRAAAGDRTRGAATVRRRRRARAAHPAHPAEHPRADAAAQAAPPRRGR